MADEEPEKPKKLLTVRQKAAFAKGRAKGLEVMNAPKPPERVLESGSDGLLPAMQWVVRHGPEEDRTWEQKSARQWKDTSPGAFYSRMVALEESPTGQVSVESEKYAWDPDGKDRCPTCRRFPGVADPDDLITPEMSDDEVDEGIEKEFTELQAFLATRQGA